MKIRKDLYDQEEVSVILNMNLKFIYAHPPHTQKKVNNKNDANDITMKYPQRMCVWILRTQSPLASSNNVMD